MRAMMVGLLIVWCAGWSLPVPATAQTALTRATWERMSASERAFYAGGYLDGLMDALTPGGRESSATTFYQCLTKRRLSALEVTAIVEKSLQGDGSWQPKDMPLSLVLLGALGDTCKP
jgi:hypothetical protein